MARSTIHGQALRLSLVALLLVFAAPWAQAQVPDIPPPAPGPDTPDTPPPSRPPTPPPDGQPTPPPDGQPAPPDHGQPAPPPHAPPPAKKPRRYELPSWFYLGVAFNTVSMAKADKTIVGDGVARYPEVTAIEKIHALAFEFVLGFRFWARVVDFRIGAGMAVSPTAGGSSDTLFGPVGRFTLLLHPLTRGRVDPFFYAEFGAILHVHQERSGFSLLGGGGLGLAYQISRTGWIECRLGYTYQDIRFVDNEHTVVLDNEEHGVKFKSHSLHAGLAFVYYF